MIDIIHNPIKKVHISEYIYYKDYEELAAILTLNPMAQSATLFWAQGIIFIASPAHQDSEIMVEKYLEGEVYWNTIAFSKMSDFQGHVRIKGMEIPVIDVSKSEVMNSIAAWLKKKIK